MQWVKVLGGILGAAALLGLGIIVGHFAIPKVSDSQDLDQRLLESVLEQLDASKIRENLRELSRKPHLATSPRDEELVQLLLQRWRDPQSGLDSAQASQYEVLLSFPSQEQPNRVDVVGGTGTGNVQFSCRRSEEDLTGEQGDPEVVPPYAAYAPAGTCQGLLVYANRGTEADFQELQSRGITLQNTIALTRYGGAGRGAKAVNAAKFGVAGVLVYTDPADINDGHSLPSETFPHSWRLPPSGVERGSYYEYFGDPLTPYLPAKPSSFRLDSATVPGFPPIPTQPIGFEDAKVLLCQLKGPLAPPAWQGALGCNYNLGPGFQPGGNFTEDSQVKVSVHNRRELRNSSNVLGIIRGAVEPDRYVLYGNHRDSWVHGAVDPSSGTAVLLELSRVLGTLLKRGNWRPRRSIVFASWGAEEFGLIGSTEFTEEFFSKLQERTVAYINVDISVFANATLRAQGTPPVQSVVFSAAKQIPAPGAGHLSIYDNWIRHFNRSSSVYGLVPSLGSLGAGSDYAPFVHFLGISSMDIAYTYDRSKTSARIYPTYHTAFDTFDYVDKFLDPGFSSHQAVARTAGSVLLRLSDSLFLPLNISDYCETLHSFLQAAQQELGALLEQHNISLEPLVTATKMFEESAKALDQHRAALQMGQPDPLQVRMLNDQLMLLERAFLNSRAFPEERYYSHVLWAPRSGSTATFPGLANACAKANATDSRSAEWAEVRRQLSIVVAALEGAAATLKPVADL
ncbi:PREDICTED: N-acetylated-alpha-linked acidic dipeptidase-like protein [Condylura cristata]|uniref:N-acetylated-alpha-linked acidic dipeptidase-like protein n=1 Tax=Condylura cristata TaxID=143302 RepID=UPI00033434F5|nr:PREDICTED: N-acetylated-alpha-linked acidic dipeptidase-like protein [Condylura cristata]